MKKKYYILLIILFPVLAKAQTLLTFTSQAGIDAYNFQSGVVYFITLENDTNLADNAQINDLSSFLVIDTVLRLEILHTQITSLHGIENVEWLGYLGLTGNTKLDTLFLGDQIKKMGTLWIQETYLKYIYGLKNLKAIDALYFVDNDYLKNVELSLDELDSMQTNVSLTVQQNDSLNTFYWNNPHHQLSAFSFFENRQLKHVHLETVKENVSSISESNGGFVFNLELDSISGCVGLDSVHSLIIKQNYMLNNACVFQKGVDNYLIDHPQANFFIIENNATGLKSLNDLLTADCSWLPNGVAELPHQELTLYPNPAHNEVFVKMLDKTTPYQIYDMSGKVVQQGKVETNGRIGLSAVTGGMYILLIGEKRSKLVIQ